MVDALADFQQDVDLPVGGVSLVQTAPPLLDALQGGSIGNSDSRGCPQLFHPFLLQHAHVALELLEDAVVTSGGMDVGVQMRRDGLQSHLVKRELNQSVWNGRKRGAKTILFSWPTVTLLFPDFSGSSLTNLRVTDVRDAVQKGLNFLRLQQNLPQRCERRPDSL